MKDKIALEEHVSTEAMNSLWDDAGEASRNGKQYMDWVQERLPDLGRHQHAGQPDWLWRQAGSLASQHDGGVGGPILKMWTAATPRPLASSAAWPWPRWTSRAYRSGGCAGWARRPATCSAATPPRASAWSSGCACPAGAATPSSTPNWPGWPRWPATPP